jgi:Ni/Fe-hydrogenase subunit HybB-like protein
VSVLERTRARTWRMGFWPAAFGLVLAAFLAVTVMRFTRGLGAVTNLSDRFPWGLWIGFDILCGVGLAAGAFTLMATASSRSCARRCSPASSVTCSCRSRCCSTSASRGASGTR